MPAWGGCGRHPGRRRRLKRQGWAANYRVIVARFTTARPLASAPIFRLMVVHVRPRQADVFTKRYGYLQRRSG